jgi:hypothetical protein
MFDDGLGFLLHRGLVQRPVQLLLHHPIVNVEEVILPVFGLELGFQALRRILKLLAEFLVRNLISLGARLMNLYSHLI